MSKARIAAGGVLLLAAGAVACGASVSQRYESDVRFERCLALDWQRTIDPGIRQRCWQEWVRHYARGQTRDRIEYARAQLADIEGRAAGREAAIRAEALPTPTSVFSPVPMMANPTGAATVAPPPATAPIQGGPAVGPSRPNASSLAPPVAIPVRPNASDCEKKCDKNLEGCLSGCKVPVCEQFCAQKHGRCSGGCPKE